MNKDNRIELYRVLFAMVIVIFHAHNVNNGNGHPIPLGHVFVEAFFFLTGYYTYAHIQKRIKEKKRIDILIDPFKYTIYILSSIAFAVFLVLIRDICFNEKRKIND
jgi:peptidoglycan/LPS O-acetylase OafA/YrhL